MSGTLQADPQDKKSVPPMRFRECFLHAAKAGTSNFQTFNVHGLALAVAGESLRVNLRLIGF